MDFLLLLWCNKRSAYTKRLIPNPRRRGGPISKHVHVQERTKILDMHLKTIEDRNDRAGEGQQQSNHPTEISSSQNFFVIGLFNDTFTF
jgi:hypothetical protein